MRILSDEIKKTRYEHLKGLLKESCLNKLKRDHPEFFQYFQYHSLVDYIKGDFDTLAYVHNSLRQAIEGYSSTVCELVATLTCIVEETWSYEHNLHFYVDMSDKHIKEQKVDWVQHIDMLRGMDVLIDIKYKDYYYTVIMMQQNYKHVVDEETRVSGFIMNCNGIHEGEDYKIARDVNDVIHADFVVFPEVSDRFYNSEGNLKCMNCEAKCNLSSKIKVEAVKGTKEYVPDLMIIPRGKRDNGMCINMRLRGITAEELRNIVYYCLNSFCSKKVQRESTLERDNSPRINISTKSINSNIEEVNSELKRDYRDTRFITLQDSVRLERKRTGSKHSSHSSPRRHVRRATFRHLKSGKIVPVKGSIVNPDNVSNDIIYKINAKENNNGES